MKDSIIIKSCIYLWGLVIYGTVHGEISKSLNDKFSGLFSMLYTAYSSCELLSTFTAVLITGVLLYFASRKYEDHHFSWNKLCLEIFGIEVLWLIPYDWQTPTVGMLPISLFHYGAILVFALIVADAVRWLSNQYDKRKPIDAEPFTIDTISHHQIDAVRAQYADEFMLKFQAIENDTDSYSVVFYGNWGSGKTVFLRYIETKLREKHQEVIWFNPWKCQSIQQINIDFFNLLTGVLKQYDSSLAKPILKYSDLLDSVEAPKIVEYIINLFSSQEDNMSELKDHIIESLSEIKVPIYILIDDLDRMDADEILAVIGLLRNTANFPYLKYVVGCDRDYLLEKLKEKNIDQDYLQKIFMAEFYLPEIYVVAPYYEECRKDIEKMTQDVFVHNFFEVLYGNKPSIINQVLGNIRQAKRFARELVLDWEFAKKNSTGRQLEILFEDYFWIELLKYHNQSVYMELQNNPSKFFDTKKNPRHKVPMYVLKKFQENQVKDKIETKILEIIFPYDNSRPVSSRSVALVENYVKYFSFGKALNHISQSEFVDLLNRNNLAVVEEKVNAMTSDEQLSLQHLMQMQNLSKFRLEDKKGYIDIFYALSKSPNHSLMSQIVEDGLIPLLKDSDEKVKSHLLNRLNVSTGYGNILVSSSICNSLLYHSKVNDFTYLPEGDLKNIMKKNFAEYVEKNKCDASEILIPHKGLNRMASLSVVCYPVFDDDDNFDYNSYDSVIFEDIINYFKEHKSKNLQAIKDFEIIVVPDEYPQEALDELEMDKQEKIENLFGSTKNYERFKTECFE
mgnify:CR=1 FL=1